ncbi:hypothetical protein HispidOSU_022979, partial [Sigmodon hispidus]
VPLIPFPHHTVTPTALNFLLFVPMSPLSRLGGYFYLNQKTLQVSCSTVFIFASNTHCPTKGCFLRMVTAL